jgi:hypothetical protein
MFLTEAGQMGAYPCQLGALGAIRDGSDLRGNGARDSSDAFVPTVGLGCQVAPTDEHGVATWAVVVAMYILVASTNASGPISSPH